MQCKWRINDQTIIGLDTGFSPIRLQAIIRTNAGLLFDSIDRVS